MVKIHHEYGFRQSLSRPRNQQNQPNFRLQLQEKYISNSLAFLYRARYMYMSRYMGFRINFQIDINFSYGKKVATSIHIFLRKQSAKEIAN